MKYKEVKDALLSKGWTLEYVQTSGMLEMLHFEHPNMKGQIIVDFDYDIELPENIGNGEEFNYIESEFLNEYNINSVFFLNDIGISYMSDDVLDTCGERYENTINLYGDDIDKHFRKILSFMDNPFIMLDFQKEYNEKVEKFNTTIKKFFPILAKFGIVSGQFAPYAGDFNAIFRNYSFYFKVDNSQYDTVDFNFNLFNDDKNEIFVRIGGEEYEASIDSDISVFEKRMSEIMAEYEKLKVLRKEKISSKNLDN